MNNIFNSFFYDNTCDVIDENSIDENSFWREVQE